MDPALPPILRVVAGFFGVLALVLGIVSLILRARKPELVREIWLRYVSWGALAAVMLVALVLGREWWIATVAILALVCLHEYARAVGLWLDKWFLVVIYTFVILMHVMVWWPWPDDYPEPGWYGMFAIMPVYSTLALFAIPILRGEYKHMLQRLALGMLGIGYIGWFLAHFAYMVNLRPAGLPNGIGMIVFLLFVTALNDVGAYVSGKLFGRHKMRPTLSPGKTWEGWLGSLVFVLVTAYLLRWLVPYYSTPLLLGMAVLLNLASTAGDLALSVIKRDLGIKDWAQTLPGHGGFLDRLNSLIFATPVFFHATRYLYM